MRPPVEGSWFRFVQNLAPKEKRKFIKLLTEDEAALFERAWVFHARAAQYEPLGLWKLWIIKAGRGFGKTRSGAEWVKENALIKGVNRQALVSPTNGDLRKVMIEGESGILAVCPDAEYSSQRQTVFFPNGAIAEGFSAEEPNRLRGPNFEKAWCDELAAWKYDKDTWDNLQFALRLGSDPQTLITTTPKPRPLFKKLLKKADFITGGSTYENKDNLAPGFIEVIRDAYEGTRLGRQELHAEVIEDVEGALWNREIIKCKKTNDFVRKVVAIDPATTSSDESDEVGLIVAGKGADGFGYVIQDASCRVSPNEWARRAVNLYHAHNCDRIIAEGNNGGDLVESVIRTVDSRVPYKKVNASRGKRTRAEPIAALYEQGKIYHEEPFDALEDQMCNWVPDSGMKSPDRMDAMVWSFTELMLGPVPNYEIY